MTSPLAVAVIGYNRPHYFEPTIRSILANRHIVNCDLWLFLDGGKDSRQEQYENVFARALSESSNLPRDIYLVRRHDNYGCDRNIIDAKRHLFDEAKYGRVLMFEDDMVVSPHYIVLVSRLLDWVEFRFSDVGAVQGYFPCLWSKEDKAQHLDQVCSGNPHWWGYLMPQWAWNEIRATLYEYERRFLNSTDYHAGDGAAIRLWAKAKLRSKVEFHDDSTSIMRGKNPFPTCWDYRSYFQGAFATGQDAMTVLAMTLAGLQKVSTSVNRSQPIGAVGIHFSHQEFADAGLDQITLDVFEDDETRTDFRTVSALRPFMREDELAAFRSLIHERKPARILEFGAGGSTIEFSKEEGVQSWCSLEHHGKWSAIVADELARSSASEKVTLICCPKQQYLEQARQLIKQGFDLYFVDGIEREGLLRELAESVRHRPACVLLHDASRAAYQNAIALYPRRSVLTEGDGKHQGLILLEGDE